MASIYGDGSNGALTVSGTTSLLTNTKYQYTDLTITGSGTLTTSSTSGAVLYILCSGTFNLQTGGKIDVSNKMNRGQRTDSVTIDGVVYNSPSVSNGGSGRTGTNGYGTAGSQSSGYGGGGAGNGGYTVTDGTFKTGGTGGTGGASPSGGGGVYAITSSGNIDYDGNAGVQSGGGSGTVAIKGVGGVTTWATSGAGAGTHGGNGGVGSGGISGSGTYAWVANGGGAAGGLAGRAGVHVVIKAKTLIINGQVITSGTGGGNGGNGGQTNSHVGLLSGVYGGSGGGGGGGKAGNLTLVYDLSLTDAKTFTATGGAGGAGGTLATTATSGTAGTSGSATTTRIIETTTTITKSATYTASDSPEIYKDAKYTVPYVYSTTKSAQYYAGVIKNITKTAEYRVAISLDKTKTVDYEVAALKNITKGSVYTITGQADITKGSDYFVATPHSFAYTSVYEVDAITIQKSYMYKVYSSTGTYLDTWTNDVSDFTIREELNTAGSVVTVKLPRKADDFGEGSSVDYANKVEIYVIDKEAPNGLLRFTGFITAYESDYSDESVTITISSYGAELQYHMMHSGSNTTVTYSSQDPSVILKAIIDTYNTDGGEITYANNVYEVMTNLVTNPNYEASVIGGDAWGYYDGVLTLDTAEYYSGTKSLKVTSNSAVNNNGFIHSVPTGVTANTIIKRVECKVKIPTGSTLHMGTRANSSPNQEWQYEQWIVGNDQWQHVVFDEEWTHSVDFTPSIQGCLDPKQSGVSFWVDEVLITTDSGVTGYFDGSTTDTSIDTYAWTGTANASTSTRTELTSPETIQATGTTVSYTFNTNTVKEGIDKCLELAPENWYYYVDQATNKLHFHELATTPAHTISIGKDIKTIKIKKDLEKVINTVYFSGGGDPVLYKKYTIPASITAYGIRGARYKDGRVTVVDTALKLSNKLLRGDPEILVTVSLVDSNLNDLGYDLESITIGETLKIGSSGIGPSSQYDIGTYDSSPFDYDLSNLSSIVFQITSMIFTGDEVEFTLATTPPDITKRIQDINRNLLDIQNIDNPTAPS